MDDEMTGWDWVSSDLPERDVSVLRHVLEARAAQMPDKIYVHFEDGQTWTYRQTLETARRAAAGLAALGVGMGDVVFAMMPNGPDFLKTWFGVNFLGAALASANVALRGATLQHLISLTAARVAVVDGAYIDRLRELDLSALQTLVVSGAMPDEGVAGVTVRGLDSCLEMEGLPPPPDLQIEPWQTQFILFTSGTTGPSKGAVVTYVQTYDTVMAIIGRRLNGDDVYLVNLPLFHVSGLRATIGMMALGGSLALISQFRTETFWETTRRYGTTACALLGSTASFLESQPPRDDDADNPIRSVAMVPMVRDPQGFSRRFGVDVMTSWGMSEVSNPITSEVNPSNPDSAGKLRPGYAARLVDDHDQEVADGEAGELVLRADRPWTISPCYWRMPEATAAVWRNGWFHTGDRFRKNEKGEYFFLDRQKDTIRRRGENISSFEVEAELLTHPAISEAAAVGVVSPHGEEDVMVVAVLAPGSELPPPELLVYLRPRMGHFMLPRYIRYVAALPKTATMRVQKHLLRAEGVTGDTWDREAAGIVVKRDTPA